MSVTAERQGWIEQGTRAVRGATEPEAGQRVIVATDLARTKWVTAVQWNGQTHRTVATPGELRHLQQLVAHYHPRCAVEVVYEVCGFGYEIAWSDQGCSVIPSATQANAEPLHVRAEYRPRASAPQFQANPRRAWVWVDRQRESRVIEL